MKYIKPALWIVFLALLYASGLFVFKGLSAEFLLIFSGAYAFSFKNIKSSIIVAVICAVLMSGLGGRGFAYSIISCVYFSAWCIAVPNRKIQWLNFISNLFLAMIIFEGLFYFFFCLRMYKLQPICTKRNLLPALLHLHEWVVLCVSPDWTPHICHLYTNLVLTTCVKLDVEKRFISFRFYHLIL